MARLYKRYGGHLVLLDATYKTTKWALPLFFLVVQSNVCYQLAGVIVIEKETAEITEACVSV